MMNWHAIWLHTTFLYKLCFWYKYYYYAIKSYKIIRYLSMLQQKDLRKFDYIF